MKQQIVTNILWFLICLEGWVHDHIVTKNVNIQWQDHLRWWLQSKIMAIYSFFYNGSDQEILDGIEFIETGVDLKYFTERQLDECPYFIEDQGSLNAFAEAREKYRQED